MITVLMPILFTEPSWQVPMTKYALDCLAIYPGAGFNLVIVETGSSHLQDHKVYQGNGLPVQTKYVNIEEKSQWTADANAGLKWCDGEFVVHTGNDVFVRPGWARELLRPFEDYADCGVSCLASGDLPKPISDVGDHIIEGVYGPFMMFRRQWLPEHWALMDGNAAHGSTNTDPFPKTFDEDFPDIFSDTDLVLAHYAAGLRSYRNHRVRIEHLNRATYNDLHSEEAQVERFHKYRQQMADKHFKTCGHLRMFHHLIDGHVV